MLLLRFAINVSAECIEPMHRPKCIQTVHQTDDVHAPLQLTSIRNNDNNNNNNMPEQGCSYVCMVQLLQQHVASI
jgi:hypothetical protein